MTERLYYTDPKRTCFDAQVQTCVPGKGGWEVVLDRTAFYPEGGGQPCDLGVLGEGRVLDVQERGDDVVHLVDAPLEGAVSGRIDRERRFDLTQQHSGEHLVSGLVHSLYGWDNVGFHMGAELITIDFNGPLTMEQLAEVERLANRAVWDDLPTEILWPDAEALEALEYRSKKALTGRVRIVRFPGVDSCACCGTHVTRTGEIGLIKLLSCVRFHQGVRVELLCGQRAMRYLCGVWEQNREVSGLLSAKPLETARAVRRQAEELVQIKQERAHWQSRCFAAAAASLQDAGDVLLFEDGLDPDALRRLSVAVMERCGGRCAVFSGDDASGYAYAVGQVDGDLRAEVRRMNEALRGRGGGKPFFCQGRVAATRAEIEAFFHTSE